MSCKIAEKVQNYGDRSLFISRGGRRILGGITWFLGEQKGGSVVLEKLKGEITENFGRIQRGGICLENERMGSGGIAKVIKSY